MTDARTRELERAAREGDPQARARLLSAQLRAGTLTAPLGGLRPEGGRVFRLAEGVERSIPVVAADPVPGVAFGGAVTGTFPVDPQAVLRLRAYLGCEWAREALPRTLPSWWSECHPANTWRGLDAIPQRQWTYALSLRAAPMPKVLGEGPCTGDGCRGMALAYRNGCACYGTGRASWEVDYSRWLLAAVGAGVARAALEAMARDRPGTVGGYAQLLAGRWERDLAVSGRVVEAAENWCRCPCPEHEAEWDDVFPWGWGPDWLPAPGEQGERTSREYTVAAASRLLLGEPKTGEAAREAARRVIS